MTNKDVVKQLVPGIVVGFVLGYVLTLLVGVNTENPIPNYIGGAMCCLIPTILNGVIVLKGTSGILKRKLSIGKALLKILPYALCAAVFGVFVVAVVVERIIGISSCDISTFTTALYEAILGVIVSTTTAYLALKSYEKKGTTKVENEDK